MLPQIGIKGYILFWYVPKRKEKKQKVKIIYGIKTTDDERTSTIKAYCATYDIALREAKKYSDWWSEKPASKKNIIPIEVIVE